MNYLLLLSLQLLPLLSLILIFIIIIFALSFVINDTLKILKLRSIFKHLVNQFSYIEILTYFLTVKQLTRQSFTIKEIEKFKNIAKKSIRNEDQLSYKLFLRLLLNSHNSNNLDISFQYQLMLVFLNLEDKQILQKLNLF
jgi:hypothetical protein